MSTKNEKKFIDKRKSVTFQLVHRSMKDPLIVDETAPQRVLVPVINKETKLPDHHLIDKSRRKKREYGIFFDDDYNYLQHLKNDESLVNKSEKIQCIDDDQRIEVVKGKQKIHLPSSVFESSIEEKIGLLNKTIPSLENQIASYDPDVIAALDDDFDYTDPDNLLEDNFIELANDGNFIQDNIQCSKIVNIYGKTGFEKDLDNINFSGYAQKDDDSKSHFTEYSMSSSIIKRNEQLSFLDDKFAKIYTSYDENEIGALDGEDIEGHMEPHMDTLLEYSNLCREKAYTDIDNIRNMLKDQMKITCQKNCISDQNDFEKVIIYARENENWDCASTLNTSSQSRNKPQLISESPYKKDFPKIEINSKTGIPINMIKRNDDKLTKKNLDYFDVENQLNEKNAEGNSCTSSFNVRFKNESTNEKKERKKAFKKYRKERRQEKKINKNTFKEEKKRQKQITTNKMQNVQGNRLI